MEHVSPALVSGVVLSGFILLASLPLFSAMARFNSMLSGSLRCTLQGSEI